MAHPFAYLADDYRRFLPKVGPFFDAPRKRILDVASIDVSTDVTVPDSSRTSPILANTLSFNVGAYGSWTCDFSTALKAAIFVRANIVNLRPDAGPSLIANGQDGHIVGCFGCCPTQIGGDGGAGGSGGGGGGAAGGPAGAGGGAGGLGGSGGDGANGGNDGVGCTTGGLGGLGWANTYAAGYAFDNGGRSTGVGGGCCCPGTARPGAPGAGGGGNGQTIPSGPASGDGAGAGGGMVVVVCNQFLVPGCVCPPPAGYIQARGGNGNNAGAGGGGVIWIMTRKFQGGLNADVTGGGSTTEGDAQVGVSRIWRINRNNTLTEMTFADTWDLST